MDTTAVWSANDAGRVTVRSTRPALIRSWCAIRLFGTGTGNYRLYIQRLNNPVGCTSIAFGALPLAGSITVAGEVDCYTFAGTVGNTVRVRVIKTSGTFDPLADVVRPNGQACAAATTVDDFNCAVSSAGTVTPS